MCLKRSPYQSWFLTYDSKANILSDAVFFWEILMTNESSIIKASEIPPTINCVMLELKLNLLQESILGWRELILSQ